MIWLGIDGIINDGRNAGRREREAVSPLPGRKEELQVSINQRESVRKDLFGGV